MTTMKMANVFWLLLAAMLTFTVQRGKKHEISNRKKHEGQVKFAVHHREESSVASSTGCPLPAVTLTQEGSKANSG